MHCTCVRVLCLGSHPSRYGPTPPNTTHAVYYYATHTVHCRCKLVRSINTYMPPRGLRAEQVAPEPHCCSRTWKNPCRLSWACTAGAWNAIEPPWARGADLGMPAPHPYKRTRGCVPRIQGGATSSNFYRPHDPRSARAPEVTSWYAYYSASIVL